MLVCHLLGDKAIIHILFDMFIPIINRVTDITDLTFYNLDLTKTWSSSN